METLEYGFREGCPKCGNSTMPKIFIPAKGNKMEYLDCSCNLCGFKCSMQTSESEFEQIGVSLKLRRK